MAFSRLMTVELRELACFRKMEKYSMFNPGASQSRDSSVMAALLLAVRENNISVLRDILSTKYWPIKGYPSLDYELLLAAIAQGHRGIVNALLDHGARVFVKPNVTTPLHLAATKSNNWLDVIKRLVEMGARVDVKNEKSHTPLHVAFSVDATNCEKTDLLLSCHLRQSSDNVVNVNGLSFLHIACSRLDLEVVRKLVEANKDSINSCIIQSQCTPLHFAVEYGRLEIATYLVKNGANLYSQDRNLSTPIHLALKRRNVRLVDVLLKHDEDRKNVIDKYNLSHFMVACIGTDVSVVEDYLEMAECRYHALSRDLINARINKLSANEGYTALHLAVDLGVVQVVEFLLSRGADCCATACDGCTPHALAEKRNRADVCEALREHCYLVKRCTTTRAESPDCGQFGEEYESRVIMERIRELKYLRRTLRNMRGMESSTVVGNDDDDNGEILFE